MPDQDAFRVEAFDLRISYSISRRSTKESSLCKLFLTEGAHSTTSTMRPHCTSNQCVVGARIPQCHQVWASGLPVRMPFRQKKSGFAPASVKLEKRLLHGCTNRFHHPCFQAKNADFLYNGNYVSQASNQLKVFRLQ